MKDNDPFWLLVVAAFIPLAAVLVTGALGEITQRGFRSRLKTDAEILSNLPDESETRHALLTSVDKRIDSMLNKAVRQTSLWTRLRVMAWSVTIFGALMLATLIVYMTAFKGGFVSEDDPAFVPVMLGIYIAPTIMIIGMIMLGAVYGVDLYRQLRAKRSNR
jgi:hypothetical protein